MDLRIAGRRALVTGSSSGIGHAIAEALAREGAHVILNGRSKKNLDAAVRRLQKAVDGAVCEAVVAAASSAEGAQHIVAAIPEVDILVNNLGKYERKGFFDTTDSVWMDFYEFNVLSGIRFVRAYGQGMRERKRGRIVFISSESGLLTPVEMINYGITKTAQAALARGLAREFGGCGVTVNAVLPGPTRTEGISTMLANESKRTGKSARELEQEFFSEARPTSIIQRFSEPKRWRPWSFTPAAILRVPLLARLCGSKAASSRGSVEIRRLALSSAIPARHASRWATGTHFRLRS
jgi:NAD(P)-dependent dehydrogenase (short-subunit alcohol dehydrogenase family)